MAVWRLALLGCVATSGLAAQTPATTIGVERTVVVQRDVRLIIPFRTEKPSDWRTRSTPLAEERSGRRERVVVFAIIGATIGGIVLGRIAFNVIQKRDTWFDPYVLEQVGIGVAGGAIVGGVIGALTASPAKRRE